MRILCQTNAHHTCPYYGTESTIAKEAVRCKYVVPADNLAPCLRFQVYATKFQALLGSGDKVHTIEHKLHRFVIILYLFHKKKKNKWSVFTSAWTPTRNPICTNNIDLCRKSVDYVLRLTSRRANTWYFVRQLKMICIWSDFPDKLSVNVTVLTKVMCQSTSSISAVPVEDSRCAQNLPNEEINSVQENIKTCSQKYMQSDRFLIFSKSNNFLKFICTIYHLMRKIYNNKNLLAKSAKNNCFNIWYFTLNIMPHTRLKNMCFCFDNFNISLNYYFLFGDVGYKISSHCYAGLHKSVKITILFLNKC